MNKILLLSFFLIPYQVLSQKSDSLFSKQKIQSTQFELLFSYYDQDGNHSAITGGVGTEDLQVYMNKLVVTQILDSSNVVTLEGGIDVISSASTDNIDFSVSSASSKDNRLWISAGYQHQNNEKKNIKGINGSFSIESDYLSVGLGGTWNKSNSLGNWRYGVAAQFFADDLRWGRLNKRYRRPVTLIYPEELRDSTWFDIYMRYSTNITLDIQHDINRRMSVGFFPGFIYQSGLLSTPFHRFYFKDNARAVVENLPRSRIKIPLGVQLNSFVGNRTVIQAYYRFYWDDFGIVSHTANLEVPIKVLPQFSLTPFARFYVQTAADYFFPYLTADPEEAFFTSDYDLSEFTSYKLGLGVQFLMLRSNFFKQISLRYAYYSREDGLHYNQVSSYINMATN